MTQLLLVAHAPLASALASVARHVYPGCADKLTSLDIDASMSLEQATAQVALELSRLRGGRAPDPEVLLLVDVQGATPWNAASAAAQDAGTRIISGVNVPMLWRTLCYASEPLAQLAARAVEGGHRGVGDPLSQ